MFKLIVESCQAQILGCPYSGLEAVDFRRQHGLPEAPSNKIGIGPCKYISEEHVRKLHESGAHINGDGNWVFDEQRIVECYRRGNGSYGSNGWYHFGKALPVSPGLIKAFLDAPSADTLLAIGMDICARNAEETRAVEAENNAIQEHNLAMDAARELLKEEIGRSETKMQYLERSLKKAEERISELEGELESIRV